MIFRNQPFTKEQEEASKKVSGQNQLGLLKKSENQEVWSKVSKGE